MDNNETLKYITEITPEQSPANVALPGADQSAELVSLDSLCERLAISKATGRNWVRLGKLSPQILLNNDPYFTPEYIASVHAELKNEDSTALKSRRNKKYISGNDMYHSYVSDRSLARVSVQAVLRMIMNSGIRIDENTIRTLMAECALQLLLHDTIFPFAGSCLRAYLTGKVSLGSSAFLVDELIGNRKEAGELIQAHPELFQIIYYYEKNEDTLGLLYISLKNIGVRKAKGLYFTPAKVVGKICGKLFEKNGMKGKTFLDPCCGTGNFLLQLPDEVPFENVYGYDTDELSVLAARINMSLKYGIRNKRKLTAHIACCDYLEPVPGNRNARGRFAVPSEAVRRQFDFIFGNPPWGYEFTDAEKKRLRERYRCARGTNIESYDVFIEKALTDLKQEGVLSFVLPEALLNVRTHTEVRKALLEQCRFQYLEYLGNIFDKVQCPCIIFQVQKCRTKNTAGEEQEVRAAEHGENTLYEDAGFGMEVQEEKRNYVIRTARNVSPECFSFLTDDEEYRILEKITSPEGKCRLKGHAEFALGIVTGANAAYISDVRTSENEMILRGSDLCKFSYYDSGHYIEFRPEQFQQCAPEAFYRAPEKLLYRFICDKPVFAYDNRQTLSLNSCNILIPGIEGLDIKYILAILNSRAAQFYFRKTYNSLKMLRSHIEQLPIPYVKRADQEKLIRFANELIAPAGIRKPESTDLASSKVDEDEAEYSRRLAIYDRLDLEAAILYGLDYREYEILQRSLEGENLFLM